ncbi:MAG: hypothetical protein ACYSWZ_00950 [Planctomycetota bacterium]
MDKLTITSVVFAVLCMAFAADPVTASDLTVCAGSTVTKINASGSDPDCDYTGECPTSTGDDVTITWSDDTGRASSVAFPTGNPGTNPTWKAPDDGGDVEVTATASDGTSQYDDEGSPSKSITVTVVEVASLLPDQGTEVDDDDDNPDTKTYIIALAATGVVTVTATPNPSLSEVDLPDCWILSGAGSSKITRTVDKTTTGTTVFTCTAGSSSKTTTISVIDSLIVLARKASVCVDSTRDFQAWTVISSVLTDVTAQSTFSASRDNVMKKSNDETGGPNNYRLNASSTVSSSEDSDYVRAVYNTTSTETTGGDSALTVAKLEITEPDGNPVTDNRFAYNSAHPGVCEVTATGTTGVADWDDDLVWTITGISGSGLTSDPDPPKGPTVTFSYTTLPSLNSDFGRKTLTLSHSQLPEGCNATQEVEIYYTFAAKNWPGADPDGGLYPLPKGYNLDYAKPPYRFEKTNWYFYYSQTLAGLGIAYNRDGGSRCNPRENPYPLPPPPPFTPLVGNLNNPHTNISYTDLRHTPPFSIKNNGETLWGIDCFAWASRHEMKHYDDYMFWWPYGHDPEDDQDTRAPRPDEPETGDNIPDDIEPSIPWADGGPFETHTAMTHGDYDIFQGWDDQVECLFSQDEWEIEKYDGLDDNLNDDPSETCLDWAKYGSRWREN